MAGEVKALAARLTALDTRTDVIDRQLALSEGRDQAHARIIAGAKAALAHPYVGAVIIAVLSSALTWAGLEIPSALIQQRAGAAPESSATATPSASPPTPP